MSGECSDGGDDSRRRSRRRNDKAFRDIHDYYNDDSTSRSSRRRHKCRREEDNNTSASRKQEHSASNSDEMRPSRSSNRRRHPHRRRDHDRGKFISAPSSSIPPPYHQWFLRAWRHLDRFESHARHRVAVTSADCSDYISQLPKTPVLPPKADSTWFFNREILLATRRQGKTVIIDCLDLAMSYGERWGEIDFSGINVAINSFLNAKTHPPWKLVIFEHEWDWWRRRGRRTWEQEERFLQEIIKTRLIEILPSGPSYDLTMRQLHCVYDVETHRPVRPWEPLQNEGGNTLTDELGFSAAKIAACCGLPSSKTGRTLGQVCSLVEYTMQHQAVLLCNDSKLFPHIGLLEPALFQYICRHKQLYAFLFQRLIIQQDTLLNTHRSLATT